MVYKFQRIHQQTETKDDGPEPAVASPPAPSIESDLPSDPKEVRRRLLRTCMISFQLVDLLNEWLQCHPDYDDAKKMSLIFSQSSDTLSPALPQQNGGKTRIVTIIDTTRSSNQDLAMDSRTLEVRVFLLFLVLLFCGLQMVFLQCGVDPKSEQAREMERVWDEVYGTESDDHDEVILWMIHPPRSLVIPHRCDGALEDQAEVAVRRDPTWRP